MKAQDPMRGGFVYQYLVSLLWSSTGDNGEPLDDDYIPEDFTPEAKLSIRDQCADFLFKARRLHRQTGATLEQCAHDFALTRNGHGAGFWGRGYGAPGRALSDICRAIGQTDAYVGDDGALHITPH